MIYLVCILVYIHGLAQTFYIAVNHDVRSEYANNFSDYQHYLYFSLCWPVTIWYLLYAYWYCAKEIQEDAHG